MIHYLVIILKQNFRMLIKNAFFLFFFCSPKCVWMILNTLNKGGLNNLFQKVFEEPFESKT